MTDSYLAEVFADGMRFALHETQADRAIMIYEGQGEAFGFANLSTLWTDGDLSLGMLEQFVKAGKPVLIKDSLMDPDFQKRTSAVLSALGSVMFIPIHNEAGTVRGFFYLDQKGRATFLSPGFFERVQRYVREKLEPQFHPKSEALDWAETKTTRWLNLS